MKKNLNGTKKKILLILSIVLILQVILPVMDIIFETNLVLKSYADNQRLTNDPDYVELYNELRDILREKDFSDEDKSMLYDVLDSMWTSYDSIERAFSVIGYPSKKEYITDNFIVPVSMLTNIECTNSLDASMASATTGHYSDGRIEIKYMNNLNHDELMYTIQHELRHVIWHICDEDFYEYMPKHNRVMLEGWATLGSLNEFDISTSFHKPHSGKAIETDEEGYVFNVGALAPSEEYGMLANVLMKLMIVIGYENMLKWEKGELSVDEFRSILNEVLGEETAERFITDLNETILNYESMWREYDFEEVYAEDIDTDKIVDIENIIFDLLKERLSKSNKKDDIQDFFNFYFIYRKLFCTRYEKRVYTELGPGVLGCDIYDHTNEKLNTDDIENLLIDKAIEYNAVTRFSEDDQLNRAAIKALFSTDCPYTFEIPTNLFNACYQYSENGDSGIITMTHMKVKFDMEGNVDTNYSSSYKVDTGDVILKPTPKVLSKIAITKSPDKKNYAAGQNFDPTGMVVTAYYEDGSSKVITDYMMTNTKDLKDGQTFVVVFCVENGKTYTALQPIFVRPAIGELLILDPPTKTTYMQGESFDTTGLIAGFEDKDGNAVIIMNDKGLLNIGSVLGEVPISGLGTAVYGDVDVINGDKLIYGQKKVNVTFEYDGVTYIGEIEINVLNGSEQYKKSLRIVHINESNLSYRSRRLITPGDLRVIATYDDGSTEEITEYTILDQYVDENGDRKVTIRYQVGDEMITETITTTNELTGTDETTAQTKIPNTGAQKTLGILVFISIIGAIITHNKSKKYKKIK
ncbi:MAG: hypothetical protein IKE91_02740 [Clostridia bacterium]|nr:hypothetical protein [Clostridia bacterium]